MKTVSPHVYRRFTLAALVALSVIVVTGAAVRLTGSGLGCSDWPNCEQDQFVGELSYHTAIEQGNRWFTGLVAVSVCIAVLGAYRRSPRRGDLIAWAWGLVAGVVGQIVLGGIVVLSHLNPWLVLGHFLLSMVLVWNAVVLHRRAAWGDAELGHVVRYTPTYRHVLAVQALVAAAIFVGTLVTGSGPHTGSRDEPIDRLGFDVPSITRVHGVVVITLLVALVALAVRLRRAGRNDLFTPTARLAALLATQAVIGYVQYFNGVPVLLVAIHIAMATLIWIATVDLAMTARLAEAERLDTCVEPMLGEPV